MKEKIIDGKSMETVLIVDDDRANIDVLVETLSGYHRRIALNGKQALRLARMEPLPDLILLDIMMPEMDGFEVCRRLKADAQTRAIPILFISAKGESRDKTEGFELGADDYLVKPVTPHIVELRVKHHLELKRYQGHLEEMVQQRTLELKKKTLQLQEKIDTLGKTEKELSEKVDALEQTKLALRKAMGNLLTIQVMPGVFWLQIPEAGLYILCGCPAEVFKHLKRQGLVHWVKKDGVVCETGPNVILLSELLVQNGGFANLSEFPVLQMLYRQGMILPGHPNNTGVKPMLMGCSAQVQAQMEYIHRGKHGLVSKEEILACGIDEETAEVMMRVKLKFAYGSVQPPSELLDTLEIDEQPVSIRNGVTVCRIGFNRYQFAFQGHTADIDLNLPPSDLYPPAYTLGNHRFRQQYFAILHRGEGDGWDMNRPSMGSIIMFQGRIYLVDAAPEIFYTLIALGIDISEIEGIFHTHGHDDHFAGLPALIHSDHRLKYFSTALVRSSVAKKFAALMSLEEEKFGQFFEICDLSFDVWNDCDGLEVMPLYSPHPTETNLFMFRALDAHGYQTYAHWADLSSYQVMDAMVGEGPKDVPAAFIDKVKGDYKRYANLKKLDIGGGQIHGVAADFRDDPSDRLVLSHIDRKLTMEEMEIGSESTFGALDILIAGGEDYVHERMLSCLQTLFPNIRLSQIRMLLNCPVIEYNSGTILHRSGESTDHVDMVLAGMVVYIESASNVHNHLSFGSLISVGNLLGEQVLEGTYRAFSHCSIIRFPTDLFRTFLVNNNLLDPMETLMENIGFLRKTWLFGEQIPFMTLGNISRRLELISVPAGVDVAVHAQGTLWLVLEGNVILCDKAGHAMETIKVGGFFGEHNYFEVPDSPWRFVAGDHVKLYSLQWLGLLEMPIVHWKILEIFERRRKYIRSS
ncbi:MAG: response regulator [Nitrospirae bacterium]|nr:response regulator [Magnetococcales bacterium]HAT50690.1 cyclic nucleotide-binding protein [Alphaproteobacteria bacterium]